MTTTDKCRACPSNVHVYKSNVHVYKSKNVHVYKSNVHVYKSKNVHVQFNAFKIEYRDLFSYTVPGIQMVTNIIFCLCSG